MVPIGIIGTILILSLLLWPLIVSLIFTFFLNSHKRAFFISSLSVGYVVYLTPVFLNHLGVLDSLGTETRILVEWLKLLFPLITSIFLTIYWTKIKDKKIN
jgi:hypothetical protein